MPQDLLSSADEADERVEFSAKSEGAFAVNDRYAAKYAERKEREELSRLKSRYADEDADSGSDDDTTSDEEDENGDLVTPEVDSQILRTIAMIQAKEPAIYKDSTVFFRDEDLEADRQARLAKLRAARSQRDAPVTLKAYQRELLLEHGGVVPEDEAMPNNDPTYGEEQADLKAAFVQAAATTDAPGDSLLEIRQKTDAEAKADEDAYRKFLLESLSNASQGAPPQLLAQWRKLEKNPEMDEQEAFLMNYVLGRGWMEAPDKRRADERAMDAVDLSEDDEQLAEMEEFERKHNFRFEEEGGAQLVTHSRHVADSLRRPDTRRKEARARRQERQTAEAVSEQNRLRELKRRELFEKMEQIRSVGGCDEDAMAILERLDLDGDFDPAAHDAQLAAVFDDGYYSSSRDAVEDGGDADEKMPEWAAAKDPVDVSDLIKEPATEVADAPSEMAGLTGGQKKKLARKLQKQQLAAQAANPTTARGLVQELERKAALPAGDEVTVNLAGDSNEDDEAYAPDESGAALTTGKKPSKREQRAREKEMRRRIKTLDDYLAQAYPVDCEDMIAGQATRFRYRTVAKNDYGLQSREILLADDGELNQYVSLKRLAPYRRPDLVARDEEGIRKAKRKRVQAIRRSIREAHGADALPAVLSDASTLQSVKGEKRKVAEADIGKAAEVAEADNGKGAETKKSKKLQKTSRKTSGKTPTKTPTKTSRRND